MYISFLLHISLYRNKPWAAIATPVVTNTNPADPTKATGAPPEASLVAPLVSSPSVVGKKVGLAVPPLVGTSVSLAQSNDGKNGAQPRLRTFDSSSQLTSAAISLSHSGHCSRRQQ